MIRKYARLEASPGTVREVFRDLERWPAWMPSVETMEILEKSPGRIVADVGGRLFGRPARRRMEFRFDEQGFIETQLSGPLKRWRAEWRFGPPPSGSGTVVSTQIEIDLGLMGYFVPRRRVHKAIDEIYDLIVGRAEARARRRETLVVPTFWGVAPGEKLSIRVYETPTELEVWFGERRFVVPAAE